MIHILMGSFSASLERCTLCAREQTAEAQLPCAGTFQVEFKKMASLCDPLTMGELTMIVLSFLSMNMFNVYNFLYT